MPSGLFLSNLVILAVQRLDRATEFATWGWRIPFMLSIVLVGVGLWIRLGILETPVFRQLVETNKIERAPIVEVFRKQPREIILSALLRMAEQAPFYIFTAFIFAYGVGTLKMSRDLILSGGAGGVLRVVRHHSAVGPHLRPDRSAQDVPDRRRATGAVRLSLFRHARHARCRWRCSSRSCCR